MQTVTANEAKQNFGQVIDKAVIPENSPQLNPLTL
jgi:hypothetical protein